MKPLFVVLILLCGAAVMSAHAQSTSQAPTPGAWPAAPAHSPAEVVEMLGKRLSLTDEQKSQILPIITERQQKIQAIRNDPSLPPRQRMSQAQGIMKDSDAKINALLTQEQRLGYSQIEQDIRARMKPYHQQGSAAQ
jgi:periplasmic protein CpxP/Spy